LTPIASITPPTTQTASPDATIQATQAQSSAALASIAATPREEKLPPEIPADGQDNGEKAQSVGRSVGKEDTSFLGYIATIGILLLLNLVLTIFQLRNNLALGVEESSDSASGSDSILTGQRF
jgi:hypothetical protein